MPSYSWFIHPVVAKTSLLALWIRLLNASKSPHSDYCFRFFAILTLLRASNDKPVSNHGDNASWLELIRKIQYVPFHEKKQVMLSYVEQYASSSVIDHFLLRMAKCYNFTAWGWPRGRSRQRAPLNHFFRLNSVKSASIIPYEYIEWVIPLAEGRKCWPAYH